MSELIQKNENRANVRWKLLTGVSALALTAYVLSTDTAAADDTDRPTVWIELGGQLDQLQGLSRDFTAPFMTAVTPTPSAYSGDIFSKGQKTPLFAFGLDGKISVQPEGSDWIVSAGITYGRSRGRPHLHRDTANPPIHWSGCNAFFSSYCYAGTAVFLAKKVADSRAQSSESHAIVDFAVGKDVGIGLLGRNSSSNINVGVRFAQFSITSKIDAYGVPNVTTAYPTRSHFVPYSNFHEYTMHAHAERSFHGVGPSLSWNGSAALLGNTDGGELTLDVGINAALLFGRQKAKTDHATRATQMIYSHYAKVYSTRYSSTDPSHNHHSTRSRSVTVPNLGGFAGVSYRYTNAKLSMGYRFDTFFGAMDTGIDTAKESNVSFNGPYASISIGLGG